MGEGTGCCHSEGDQKEEHGAEGGRGGVGSHTHIRSQLLTPYSCNGCLKTQDAVPGTASGLVSSPIGHPVPMLTLSSNEEDSPCILIVHPIRLNLLTSLLSCVLLFLFQLS